MTEHNLSLDEEQTMVLETVRKFATDVAGKHALDRDEHRQYAEEGVSGLAELGLLGLPVAEEAGGAGMGMLSFAIALLELSRSCGSSAAVLATQAGSCGKALEGLPEAAERFGPLGMGEKLAAFVGPEAKVQAAASGDEFSIKGNAALVLCAARCDHLLVAAELDGESALFLISADKATIESADSLGFRAAAPGRVMLDATVPGATLIARGADAATAIARGQVAGWVAGAAIALGAAEASVAASRRHAGERMAFGKPLSKQQAVDRKLVQCDLEIESARHLLFHAARTLDAGQDAGAEALRARIAAVEAAVRCSDEAIQIHGGFGYTVEYHVERHYRDAKTLQVLDGGIDAQLDRLSAAVAGST